MVNIRVRFAPSPTGPLHIGNIRAALFNYLFAKHNAGKFILRIEDTDRERSKKEYEEMILASLEWLGIEPDEGPRGGGAFGPYRQSERLNLYRDTMEKLLKSRSAFYCPHSSADDKTQPTIHWCEYRDGGGDTENSIIRFRTPKDRTLTFHDLVRGRISVDTNTLGDFSIAKSPEIPLYNFANVVDDNAMRISHVLRGEDHIANTPKQLLLQEALGCPSPLYGHLPLILGPDRSKLSKRHGPVSLLEYRAMGYLPAALRNYLALLGWNPGKDQELFSLDQLIRDFSLEKVQKSGAIFDVAKLDWMNGEYIRGLGTEELLRELRPFIEEYGLPTGAYPEATLVKIISLEQPRLKRLAEIGERIEFYFRDPKVVPELLRWKTMSEADIIASLEKSTAILSIMEEGEITSKELIEKTFLEEASNFKDKGELLWPLRAALTGKRASPGPFDIISILGLNKSVERLARAIKTFG